MNYEQKTTNYEQKTMNYEQKTMNYEQKTMIYEQITMIYKNNYDQIVIKCQITENTSQNFQSFPKTLRRLLFFQNHLLSQTGVWIDKIHR